MKNLKKLIAIIMVIALMIPCTAMAATESPSKTSLKSSNTTIALSKTSFTFNNKSQKPSVKKVTYKNAAGNKTDLKEGTDYKVTVKSHKNAGTYSVTITGMGKYSGSVKASYTIKKASQKKNVKVTNKYKATKAKTFKKKAKSYTFKATGVKEKAKVTYTTSSKKIKVKNGKITLSKGIKKGTYKVTIKVAKTKNYSAYSKTVTIKVK